MKNLEEKIKEIKELCLNLDESKFYLSRSLTNKSIYFIGMHDLDDFSIFDINSDNCYNALIDTLKKHQKEPDLYTLDEIIRTIDNASLYYSHNDNYINWLKEFINNNIDTYQKLD